MRDQDLENTQFFTVGTEPETGVKLVLSTVGVDGEGVQPGQSDCRLYYVRRSYLHYQPQERAEPHYEGGAGRACGGNAGGIYQKLHRGCEEGLT